MKRFLELIREKRMLIDIINMVIGVALIILVLILLAYPMKPVLYICAICLAGIMYIMNGFKVMSGNKNKNMAKSMIMTGGIIMVIGIVAVITIFSAI